MEIAAMARGARRPLVKIGRIVLRKELAGRWTCGEEEMKRKIAWRLRNIFGIKFAGMDYRGLPDDTFLASYPRSGNTWVRMLITALIHPGQALTFRLMERTVWDTTTRSLRAISRAPRPRIVKVHQSFDPRLKRVIYVVRDPRDVALSLYDFRRKWRFIEDACPIEAFVRRFVVGEETNDYYGSWGENVASWLAARNGTPSFLLIRYEDLKADPVRELGKIALFAGIKSGKVAEAVNRCALERLREQEEREQQWQQGGRMDIPFFGPAKAGRWKETLPRPSVALIESTWGLLMKTLGYDLALAQAVAFRPPSFILADRPECETVPRFAQSEDGEKNL